MNKHLEYINIWLRQSKLCHSTPDRCFVYKNRCLPLCARCTGIVFGGMIYFIFSKLFFYILPINVAYLNYQLYFILAIPMVIDGVLQYLECIQSNNNRRFATGLFFGIGSAMFCLNATDWLFLQLNM
jgi:Predicted membrane protein